MPKESTDLQIERIVQLHGAWNIRVSQTRRNLILRIHKMKGLVTSLENVSVWYCYLGDLTSGISQCSDSMTEYLSKKIRVDIV